MVHSFKFDSLSLCAILNGAIGLAGNVEMDTSLYLKYLERHARRSRKARQDKTFTCFFTGLVLPKSVDSFSGYTVEHLIPKSLLRGLPQTRERFRFDKIQRVPSVSIINHLIGHAPLSVKFGLRDFLHEHEPRKILTQDEQIMRYVDLTRLYLSQYRVTINGDVVTHMPWYWASMAEPHYRKKLFDRYWGLLTETERGLFKMRFSDYEATIKGN